jgi:hypothetical protein
LIGSGLRDQALKLVTDTLTENPSNPRGLYLYAQLAKDPKMAMQALSNALKLQPNFFEAQMLLERLQSETSTPQVQPSVPPAATAQPQSSDQSALMQQMLMQHHMLMQQQMVNQQQVAQQQMTNQQQASHQQMLNQQQLAQQQLMAQGVPVGGMGVVVEERNGLAFWVGAIAAFFGFFGIAHIFNGKLLPGIMWLIVGFVWDVIMVALAATGVGACVALPLHLVFCYYNAKNGARQQSKFVSGTIVRM